MKIAERLASLVVPIDSLREDPENVRIHPMRNMEAIKRSLERYGQRKPIVTRNGVVIAGSGTLRGARELGATEIAAIGAEDLTEAEAKAYGIMDNKSSDLGEWDPERLGNALRDLDDELRLQTGFADFEIETLLQADFSPGEIGATSGEGEPHMAVFRATVAQSLVIERAIGAVRVKEGDSEIKPGRALELICSEYLLNNEPTSDPS